MHFFSHKSAIAALVGGVCMLAPAASGQSTFTAKTVSAPSSTTDGSSGTTSSTGTTSTSNTPSMSHDILIVDGAYFPPLVYANVGDQLVFVNESSGPHVVQGPEDTWSSGPIPIDGTFTLFLEAQTPMTFQASVETEGGSDGNGDVVLEQIGSFTFDPVPTE